MKAGIGFCCKTALVCAGLGAFVLGPVANAAPKAAPVSRLKLIHRGAKKEGPLGPGVVVLDNATKARGGAAAGGSAEALIFNQPNDSGFGFFEKTYDETFGFPMWANRMKFSNGWAPGNSISSYELKIFHSSSDDVNFGPADYGVELWDGDPYSIMETVCTTGGVSAPIPGTAATVTVPYATVVRARIVLPAKVVYNCDTVWMSMTSLTGCRAAWRISGTNASFDTAPDLGSSNGLWLFTGCESSTFGGACATDTGLNAGFCCGSAGVCDDAANPGTGSQAPCNYGSDCTVAGETCTGQEPCDHGSATAPVLCSSAAAATSTFCGDGQARYYVADFLLPGTEEGYVGSIFAATDTTMSIVPVSVDAVPAAAGSGASVISLSGDEVVLGEGNHNVWMEIKIGDWDPNDAGVTLAGYQPAIAAADGFSSGIQGTLSRFTGGTACGECDDNAAPCFDHNDCTAGTCSTAGTACHLTSECPSGETCDGSALCAVSATGNADCAAALGDGSTCGPPGYDLGTGTCSWAYTDAMDPNWALQSALATLAALDVSSIDARPSYAVVVGPANDPEPFPAGGMYAATFAVAVPADAKGTFTIDLKPFPLSALSSGSGPPIPLLGTVPGKITVQNGRCCIGLENLATGGTVSCLDGAQTQGSCDAIAAGSGSVTLFTANEVCPSNGGPPCECDPAVPSTFDDGNACTDDACIAGVPTSTPRVCDDGLVCTDNQCDPADPTGVGCFFTPVDIDDGLACTIDACAEPNGITHTPVDVDDGIACTFDQCVEPAGNITHDDLSVVPNAFPCPTGDPVADGCPGNSSIAPPLISTTCTNGFCQCVLCFTDVPCSDPLACRANIEVAWSAACADGGSKVTADVVVGPAANAAAVPVNGGQFVLNYDPSCITLNSVGCTAPYDFEIFRDVTAGRIQMACGVDPFAGINGPASGSGASLASASFTKVSDCDACATWFTSINPNDTAFTDNTGQPICADLVADAGILGQPTLSLDVPADVTTNVDCNAPTAIVSWAPPTVSSTCGAGVDLQCAGTFSDGSAIPAMVVMNGGEFPQGESTLECWASSAACGANAVHKSWTVNVSSNVSIDVTLQLSPVIAGDLRRCIKFQLFEDCTTPPTVIERTLLFGGAFDFVGHFTDTIKAPKGQYACITAQDQLHSLRACDQLQCVGGGAYSAVFKGDPFFGGNWLQNGNLDGWKKSNPSASQNVIDIFDFGQFMVLFLSTPSIDTPCSSVARDTGHGDINGDGVVDATDLAFVVNNFLDSSKDCCCGAAAGVTVPRTEVSVRELRQMGLGDMAVADLDGNGLVNTDDITAFLAGARPNKVGPVRGVKGAGVRSR